MLTLLQSGSEIIVQGLERWNKRESEKDLRPLISAAYQQMLNWENLLKNETDDESVSQFVRRKLGDEVLAKCS